MDFESANPTVVKSIRQRDLLNTWLRLYARGQKLPAMREYQPARIEEEMPDLVFFSIDATAPWWEVWEWPFEIRWSRLFTVIH